MHITQAARKLRPGTDWNYHSDGDDKLATLEQADDGTPRVTVPTMDELQEVMDADKWVESRVANYPSLGDQLDAMWKGGDAAQAMRKQVMDVKAKYPKP